MPPWTYTRTEPEESNCLCCDVSTTDKAIVPFTYNPWLGLFHRQKNEINNNWDITSKVDLIRVPTLLINGDFEADDVCAPFFRSIEISSLRWLRVSLSTKLFSILPTAQSAQLVPNSKQWGRLHVFCMLFIIVTTWNRRQLDARCWFDVKFYMQSIVKPLESLSGHSAQREPLDINIANEKRA
jgi:hypothetical protein